jgi:hypothetical protein
MPPSFLRSEAEVFRDLEQLCGSAGYIHVYAHLAFDNNYLLYSDKISGESFQDTYDPNRLNRSELSLLFGIFVKCRPIDFTIPSPNEITWLGNRTLELLHELHLVLAGSLRIPEGFSSPEELMEFDFSAGAVLREPIFYTGDSATAHQYRDLAALRYSADEAWMSSQRGFTIAQAAKVGKAITDIAQRKLGDLYNSLRTGVPDNFTFLPGFSFTMEEVLHETNESEAVVLAVLNSFCLADDDRNSEFTGVGQFNHASAQPIISGESGSYLLFQGHTFFESLYESPFYWMLQDEAYEDTAFAHRGAFTEQFTTARLTRVFGKKHTFPNVVIKASSATTVGEIDCLVFFGNRAIVVQTKSKRLTLEARRGSDRAIQKDFQASTADSYEQGLTCAQALIQGGGMQAFDADGKPLSIPPLKKAYLLCLVSDHYPALSFQAAEFLKPRISDQIPAPLITDVFMLDVMGELLETPLYFLSYIDRRTEYGDRVVANDEISILAYHLRKNLWLAAEHDRAFIMEDFTSHIDAAMLVRR